MAFPSEFIDELLAKNDIADVVGSYVTLKEKGGRFWGLCPFHTEKTPSFSVNRDRQMYYCFGCKEGGGVINFVMKTEHLTYPEAVEYLARRVNMELPQQTDDAGYEEKKKLKRQIAEMNKAAARFFVEQLYGEQAKQALAYAIKRGIDKKTAMRFGLGYAPDDWRMLSEHLRTQGFSDALMIRGGLARKKDDNVYDFFRNRLMFPVLNTFGDVIAFGGRVMDDSQPKYLNSPDTPLFNKRKNLYAINLLKEQRETRHAVLTEGYMDVISLYAAGVTGTVASLGTALTPEQAYLLKRYVKNVYVAYDGDGAGVSAAIKACGILQTAEMTVRVITFDTEDPDEFVRAHGINGFKHKMRDSRDPVDFKLDILKRDYDLSDIDGRTQYSLAALKLIQRINNDVLRERYSRRIAEETKFSYESVSAQASRQAETNINEPKRKNTLKEPDIGEHERMEQMFIARAIGDVQAAQEAISSVDGEDFCDGLSKKILFLINDRIKEGILPTCAEVISGLDEKQSSAIAELISSEDEMPIDLNVLAARIRQNALIRSKKELAERIKNAPEQQKKQLREQYFKLTNEIRAIDYDKKKV